MTAHREDEGVDHDRRAIVVQATGVAVLGGLTLFGAKPAAAQTVRRSEATARDKGPMDARTSGGPHGSLKSIDKVVLVHGAFADGSCWAKVIPRLTKRGLRAIAVQNPLSSLADDVKAVHRVVDAQEGPVLLVGHSWGGAVITEAGLHPQVKGLVYVAAGAPDSGQSFQDWWKAYPPAPAASEIKPYGDGYVALTAEGVRRHFVQDIPEREAELVFASQGPLAARCFGDKVSKAAWRSKRSWYIVAARDETIPPAVERDSAKRMGADTVVLESSHVPMLSQPGAVAELIVKAAASLSS
jgi:pimeloyl-ACP methyl ester carboxylesterase